MGGACGDCWSGCCCCCLLLILLLLLLLLEVFDIVGVEALLLLLGRLWLVLEVSGGKWEMGESAKS